MQNVFFVEALKGASPQKIKCAHYVIINTKQNHNPETLK
jgi:hypothetical protein